MHINITCNLPVNIWALLLSPIDIWSVICWQIAHSIDSKVVSICFYSDLSRDQDYSGYYQCHLTDAVGTDGIRGLAFAYPTNPWCYFKTTVKSLIQDGPNHRLKWFSSRLAVAFAQFIEARCWVNNEDVVWAAPIGDAPTTSEWATVLLPTKLWLILEVWQ